MESTSKVINREEFRLYQYSRRERDREKLKKTKNECRRKNLVTLFFMLVCTVYREMREILTVRT